MTTSFVCSQCGRQAVGSFKFCPSCGAPIVAGGPEPVAAASSAAAGAGALPPPPAPLASMLCSSCGIEFPAGPKFCPGCGTPILARAGAAGPPPPFPDPKPERPRLVQPMCGRCGKPLAQGMRLCPYCGTAIQAAQFQAPQYPPPALQSPYGGFWIRVLADLIDTAVLIPAYLIFNLIPIVGIVLSVVGTCLYGAVTESSQHQATLGKRAVGLKVTDLDGRRLTFGKALGRWVAKQVQFITVIGMLAFPVVALTDKKQGVHDLIAGTIVWRR